MNNILENKVISVQPIARANGYFEENQDGASIFTGAKVTFSLPMQAGTRQLVQILNEEEQAFFAKKLNLKIEDLDFYNSKSKFWTGFRCELTKEGKKLDLSKPLDNLEWRILKILPMVAPSWGERFDNGQFKFALVDANYEVNEINKKASRTKRAWKAFGKIEDSIEKMTDVLTLVGKNVPKDANRDWLQAEITKMIENSKAPRAEALSPIDEFLSIVEDPNYEMRLFVTKAVKVGAIRKVGKHAFKLTGVDEKEANTAENLSEMIDYLKDLSNQHIMLKIKANIEAAK